ncbi:MAG TPA: HEAT repeat domain-containing protein [Dictyobacter sp.]|nr:HEAT repeat domain-containing protein [Dictyobacter sp.]
MQDKDLPIHALIAAKDDTEEYVVHEIMILLGHSRAIEAIPALVDHVLNDCDDFSAEYMDEVWLALRDLYEQVPLEPLLQALSSDRKEVRYHAISLFSMLKERAPLKVLLSLLEHKDPGMRKYAIYGLHCHLASIPVEVIVNKLSDRNKKVRLAAQFVLTRNDVAVPEELLLPLLDCQENIARETAFELLASRVPLPRLIEAAHDHKWSVAVEAIKALGAMGDQVPFDLFLELLCDKNSFIRWIVVRVLGKQGERTPIKVIIGALHDRKRVSNEAFDVLMALGKRVPRDWLLPLLDDSLAHVRWMAIQLLEAIAYEEPFPVDEIRSMVHDSDERVREVVLQTLERRDSCLPRALLLQALDDPSASIRLMAIHLLQSREDGEPFPVDEVRGMLQDDDAKVREAAIEALNQRGEIGPVEPFIAMLHDTNRDVRMAAFRVLARPGVLTDLEPLKILVGDNQICAQAIWCLREMHVEVLQEVAVEAEKYLLARGIGQILGSIVQENVADAIGNMRNPGLSLINKLFELLNWPYGQVRVKAEQALTRLRIV